MLEKNSCDELLEAVLHRDALRAQLLLTEGAYVNCTDQEGVTPLVLAAQTGNLAMVKLLLAAGADLTYERAEGVTPLIAAAAFGHNEAVRILIDNGADPNRRTADGDTAIQAALANGYIATAQLLHSLGGVYSLHDAAFLNEEAIVREYISAGADVNQKNRKEKTAIHYAIRKRNDAMVTLFREAGAELTLHDAAAIGERHLLETFWQAGINLNRSDEVGVTPLMEAAFCGCTEGVRWLIEHGADPTLENVDGETAYVLAQRRGWFHIVALLRSSRRTN